ncbi:MAG: class I SAM-dependent methyltransferase [Salinarimonas sp.]|nr:class I SAM-dependent methyltransferase [Salinarimonas sp.]
MERILATSIARLIRSGRLTLTMPSGKIHEFGDGGTPDVAARLTDAGAVRALLANPALRLGELYMDGRLVIEQGSIYALFALVMGNAPGERNLVGPAIGRQLRRLLELIIGRNGILRSRDNVARHYDLDGRLYDLFLDGDKQYSCAYFTDPGEDLAEAQRAKKRHIAAKLAIDSSHSVLDIGCGWGGMALYLAEYAQARHVTGITLSQEQHRIARARAASAGLDERLHFALEDYRETKGPYDRIVSVGMFEHVGLRDYATYFHQCARLLADDGVALIHTIGKTAPPGPVNPWIAKYIFPGGRLPSLSEIMPAIEASGLRVTDVEILRLHYAETLRRWRERFLERYEEAEALFDARFCRMWEFYLAASEAAFRFEHLVVFQIQLAKRVDTLPMTRDYITDNEALLLEREEAAHSLRAPRRMTG